MAHAFVSCLAIVASVVAACVVPWAVIEALFGGDDDDDDVAPPPFSAA